MKKVLKTLLLVCMILITASLPVYATPPTEVSGIFDLETIVYTGTRTAGPNTFIYGTDVEVWQGDWAGVGETEWVVTALASGVLLFSSRGVFTGTVLDSDEGTMEYQLTGQIPPGGGEWYGQWVILGGTGGLANVHGQGTWWGPGYGYDPDHWYEGQVHFDP